MKSIKENSTPAIRLYNWNLIADVMKFYKYQLDYLEKSKVLNLQPQPIYKILSYLKGIYYNENGVKTEDLKVQSIPSLKVINNIDNDDALSNPLQVDIKTVQNKQITDALNIMQFFIISLSKNFRLSPQHTLNLFLDNNKYLALLFVKGIK